MFSLPSNPGLTCPVLITGPSEHGIGAETALSLAKRSPKHLILAGRSRSKIDPVIDQIQKSSPQVQVDFLSLDLSNQDSIRASVKHLQTSQTVIDVLLNNAAVMANPFTLVDNTESQFATNHLGPYLLTTLLLNASLISPTGRIVNVNSHASVRQPYMILPHLSDLTYANGATYNPWIAYSVSKAAQLLYTRWLASALRATGSQITTFSPHPGSIKSPLQRHLTPDLIADAQRILKESDPDMPPMKQKTLQQGCATQIRAALDPGLAPDSGAYLVDCQPLVRQEHVGMYGATEQVLEISERLVGEKLKL